MFQLPGLLLQKTPIYPGSLIPLATLEQFSQHYLRYCVMDLKFSDCLMKKGNSTFTLCVFSIDTPFTQHSPFYSFRLPRSHNFH